MTDLTTYTGQEPLELLDEHRLFFVAAKNSYYINRPGILGPALLPFYPPDMKDFPNKNGFLNYKFQKLPPTIMSQALDFFRRTYNRLKTEAEVLIAYNPNLEPNIKLFIPPQRVSHASVNSAFDPTHLGRGWQLIGSMHSHADFNAFHSGTDTNDAAEFDGVHITIGHVNTDKPSWAAMVTQNNTRWDFDIEDIADLKELGQHTAPLWWDRYILNDANNEKIAQTYKDNEPPPRKAASASYTYNNNWQKPTTPYQHKNDDPSWWNKRPAIGLPAYTKQMAWEAEMDDDELAMWGFGVQRPTPTPVAPVSKWKNDAEGKFNRLVDKFYEAIDELAKEYDTYPYDLLPAKDIFDEEDLLNFQAAIDLMELNPKEATTLLLLPGDSAQ